MTPPHGRSIAKPQPIRPRIGSIPASSGLSSAVLNGFQPDRQHAGSASPSTEDNDEEHRSVHCSVHAPCLQSVALCEAEGLPGRTPASINCSLAWCALVPAWPPRLIRLALLTPRARTLMCLPTDVSSCKQLSRCKLKQNQPDALKFSIPIMASASEPFSASQGL